jgi:hypothetical protein
LEESFALSCQLVDPCWEAAVVRVLALSLPPPTNSLAPRNGWPRRANAASATPTAMRRCRSNSLANQAEISLKQGNRVLAEATAREWVALAARTHMNAQIARAAAFIAQQ